MSVSSATIVVGFLSAAVTMAGWIILDHLARRKEAAARDAADRRADRLKRLELNLQQIDRQISEFYGPIHNLIYQIGATWEIKYNKMRPVLSEEVYRKVEHHMGHVYFADLHSRIREILREKAHLVAAGAIPLSFYDYMKHSIMEYIQIELWESQRIGTSEATGYPWPAQFAKDIEEGLKSALHQRQLLLAELQTGAETNLSAEPTERAAGWLESWVRPPASYANTKSARLTDAQ